MMLGSHMLLVFDCEFEFSTEGVFSHTGFNLTAANHIIFVAPGELASDLNWKLRTIGRVQHTRGVASH